MKEQSFGTTLIIVHLERSDFFIEIVFMRNLRIKPCSSSNSLSYYTRDFISPKIQQNPPQNTNPLLIASKDKNKEIVSEFHLANE